MTIKIPALRDLQEINSMSNDAFNPAYSRNLEMVCKYTNDNITPILKLRIIEVLAAVRETLITDVIKKLPTYAGKQSRKNQNKSKIIEDIIALSRSIVTAKPDPCLDSVFKNSETNVIPTTAEAVLEYVKKELNSTNNRVSKLEAENRMLREIIKSEGIDLNTHSCPNNSDTSDLTDEHETSDTECESDSSLVPQSKTPRKTPRRKTLRGKPKCLEGVPKKTFVFVGNATEECTTKEVHRHIKKNSKVKIDSADIQEIKTKGTTKAFKVSVNKDKMQDFINKTKWPLDITVKAFDSSRRNSMNPRQPRQGKKNKNMTKNRSQKFQKTQRFRRDYYTPRERSYRPYQQNTVNQPRNEYLPGGYNPGYYRDYGYYGY